MTTTQDKLQNKLDIYSLYMSVLKNFLELLQEGNNSYKHPQFYLDSLDEYLENEEKHNKRDVIVFILMTIYNERNKCRFHTNDPIAKTFETTIIQDSLKFLWNVCNIEYLLKTINHLLTFKFEPQHLIEHKNIFGCDIVVDYEEFTDINKDNVKQVYEKFASYVHLNRFRKTDREHPLYTTFQLFDDIDSYLFCLFYY